MVRTINESLPKILRYVSGRMIKTKRFRNAGVNRRVDGVLHEDSSSTEIKLVNNDSQILSL